MGQDRLSSIAVITLKESMQTKQCRMTCKGLLTYLGVEVIVRHTSFRAKFSFLLFLILQHSLRAQMGTFYLSPHGFLF